MNDTVDFVITNENWDKNFDEVRIIIDETWLGSISADLSCPVSLPEKRVCSGKERGLISRTTAGNRA